jgi:hypothetical protein
MELIPEEFLSVLVSLKPDDRRYSQVRSQCEILSMIFKKTYRNTPVLKIIFAMLTGSFFALMRPCYHLVASKQSFALCLPDAG